MHRTGWDKEKNAAVRIEMTPQEEAAFLQEQVGLQEKARARKSKRERAAQIEIAEKAALAALARGDEAALAHARKTLTELDANGGA